MKNTSGGCRNLKLRARKRFSPFPPAAGHPPTTPFQKIRNVIEPLSGGIRGQTFCSTLQLSPSFKVLSWSYKGGFSGTSFVWENCLSRTGTASACAPSARRQRPCCRLLQRYIYSPLRKRFYKCRSGRASLRSRRSAGREFFLLQKQSCQKLWPLRALKFEARLLLPSFIFQNKNLSSRSACGGQRDDLPPGSFIFQTPLRQLSKVCDCFADA